jgi:hypothetical protein
MPKSRLAQFPCGQEAQITFSTALDTPYVDSEGEIFSSSFHEAIMN